MAQITSKTSLLASEEICTLINKNYGPKIHRTEKQVIENAIKDFAATEESGCWFVSAHHFLMSLSNNFAKKILENAQKNILMNSNYSHATLFTEIKNCISINSVAAANHFCQKMRK